MFKIVEMFSGIGAQAKAFERIGTEYEIINTCDWDITAIIAYCLIHKGKIDIDKYKHISNEEIEKALSQFTLSMDGKTQISKNIYNQFSTEFKRLLYAAIKQTRNFVSITDVHGYDIEDDIDLLTYSFPCQDLSLCGCWHGNKSGISRNAHNRSGMLWEVERILKEMYSGKKALPHFLVMENVPNILSATHKKDFDDWKNTLVKLGYVNHIYRLNAKNFGVPQKRERAYMISILCNGNFSKEATVKKYFEMNNLEDIEIAQKYRYRKYYLRDVLRLNYNNSNYKNEAEQNQPNDTPSREKILKENDLLFDGRIINEIYVNTVTTKQDRNPNSGVISFFNQKEGKAKWRYLTPRECFMLMGFDESDYDSIVSNNPILNNCKKLFTNEKMHKLAGNSICVDVLIPIFTQLFELKEKLGYEKYTKMNQESLEDLKIQKKGA